MSPTDCGSSESCRQRRCCRQSMLMLWNDQKTEGSKDGRTLPEKGEEPTEPSLRMRLTVWDLRESMCSTSAQGRGGGSFRLTLPRSQTASTPYGWNKNPLSQWQLCHRDRVESRSCMSGAPTSSFSLRDTSPRPARAARMRDCWRRQPPYRVWNGAEKQFPAVHRKAHEHRPNPACTALARTRSTYPVGRAGARSPYLFHGLVLAEEILGVLSYAVEGRPIWPGDKARPPLRSKPVSVAQYSADWVCRLIGLAVCGFMQVLWLFWGLCWRLYRRRVLQSAQRDDAETEPTVAAKMAPEDKLYQ